MRKLKVKSDITISAASGNWAIRAGGAVIGETSKALKLNEGNSGPILYFPKKDLAMAFFERTDQKTTCPHKGTSGYYSIVTKSQILENIAWEFITSNLGDLDLLNFIAFVPTSKIIIERL